MIQDDCSGDNVVIITSEGQLECIVAPSANKFFVACTPTDRLEQPGPEGAPTPIRSQHVPDMPKDLIAACIFNGSVIMLQSAGKRLGVQRIGQLYQVPIRTNRKLDLHSKTSLGKLKEKPKADPNLNATAKIGIMKLSTSSMGEEALAVVVCHSNRRFEFVPLQDKAGSSSTANT